MSTVLSPPALRWYQEAAVEAFFEHVRTANGDALVVLPTGAGKSLTMASIIARARENYAAMRVAIVATQAELVQQNAKAARLLADPRDVGIYSAGLGQKDASRPITCANIQSLAKVAYAFDPFDLILIDECHTIADGATGLYRTFIDAQRKQNPAVVLGGFTATPYKLSSGSLVGQSNSLFATIAYEAPIVRLIEEGFLCRPITPRTTLTLDVSNVAMRGGEYVAAALAEAVDVQALTNAACDEIIARCVGRKHWLIFAVSVEHARHIAEALQERGVSSATVHGDLSRDERAHRIHAFTSGEVTAMVNCQLLTTGFDFPATDAIVLMRPTKSAGLYSQMVGRGLRIHPSKQDCLIVDLAGCIAQFGPIDAIIVRDKKSKGEGEAPAKVCPVCEFYQAAGVRNCIQCGHEFPPPAVRIETQASTAPILSTDVEPTWHDVTNVQYLFNPAKAPKTIPTLRVEYYSGYKIIAREWICLEHDGYARTKAEQWWARRSPEKAPRAIDVALMETEELKKPLKIALSPDPLNPKYERITGYRFGDEPTSTSALPKACWTCNHWFEQCLKWEAVPPPDVQATGCDDWTDEDDLPF